MKVDLKSQATYVILGPPGTGKTTTLMGIVETLLGQGYQPEDICFVAFTRKAANEALSRAREKFTALDPRRFKNFRTLHSLAFRRLGLRSQGMMSPKDYINIANEMGIYLTLQNNWSEDGTIVCKTRGDQILFMEQMARSRLMTIRDYWQAQHSEDIYLWELERMQSTLSAYKAANNKLDYIDLIQEFIKLDGAAGDHEILIVDEAQDLSPMQWSMVSKLSEGTQACYIAGDDDQAIFNWAGADVEAFMGIARSAHTTILPHSYRVPEKVMRVAHEIISRMKTRVPKEWEPRDESGEVIYYPSIDHIDMSQGTWLLLARNSFLLEQYKAHCLRAGYVFSAAVGSPMSGTTLQAIITWEELRAGKQCLKGDVMTVYDYLSSGPLGVQRGGKTKLDRELSESDTVGINELAARFGLMTREIWHTALDRIPSKERIYFLTALKQGEKLKREPRIKISTIHQIKGGEADNVVLLTDMAARTHNEFNQDPDPEHRVWYVAVTRAKQRLFIIQPQTNLHYVL